MTSTIGSGLRTIAGVSVTQLNDQGMPSNGFRDRKLVIMRSCGHSYFTSLPLTAPLPRVGEPATKCLACTVGGWVV